MELRKKSETANTIVLEWDSVPGAVGYRFQSEKTDPKWSHTWDASRTSIQFSKADWYKVEALGIEDAGSYPDVEPPPPPPPSGSLVLAHRSDLTEVFNDSGFSEINTPHGPGFRFVVPATLKAPDSWGPNQKMCLAAYKPATVSLGKTEDWSYRFMYPSSGNPQGFPDHWAGGQGWQWHTRDTSGNYLAVDGRPAANGPIFRYQIYNSGSGSHQDFYGPKVLLDHWYKARWLVKWSYGSDGFIQNWLDDVLIVNRTGATAKTNDLDSGMPPKLQFGWYGNASKLSEVQIAAIQRV